MADKFLVVDGSSLIHRAFFALPPLMTKKGLNTGAVYGFCNMLLRVISDVKPKWVVVAFDKSRVTFRTEMFDGYKAQRKETPCELSEQFPIAQQLLEAMNISVLEMDGYEADDIIGTFAKHKAGEAEVIILKKHEADTEESVKRAEPEAEKDAKVLDTSDFSEMTVKQIKELLDQKGIEYSFRAKKDELIELLGGD